MNITYIELTKLDYSLTIEKVWKVIFMSGYGRDTWRQEMNTFSILESSKNDIDFVEKGTCDYNESQVPIG
ncbi:hypothetical protein D3C73_779080 [compost metagenome]